MGTRGTLGFVAGRAATRRSAVAALLVSVLVLCTLVTALVTSMRDLVQDAVDASVQAMPNDDSVVIAATMYDVEEPAGQDSVVRAALAPIVELRGGTIVGQAESVSYDLLRNRATTQDVDLFRFGLLVGDEGRLELTEGRLPTAGDALEVAIPVATAEKFSLAEGDRMQLRSRLDESVTVSGTVVGVWSPPDNSQERWLKSLVPAPADEAAEAAGTTQSDQPAEAQWGPLLTSPQAFATVAGPVPTAQWRAVPEIAGITPDQLPLLADAAAHSRTELAAAAEEFSGGSMRVSNSLPEVLSSQSRSLVIFRSLLLVPAVIVLLLGLVGLTMVAGQLAASRAGEETLLRSRGAARWQLVRPSLVESLGCGLVGAVGGPLVASRVGSLDGVGDLGVAGWASGAAAGLACTVALVVPSIARASSARAERADPGPRQRRRQLAAGIFGVLLLVALGSAATAQLLRYDTVASAGAGSGTGAVDPLLVLSPALVLLTGCAFLVLATAPLSRLLARGTTGLRGLPAPLSTRSVARSVGSALPLMLVVALGTSSLWFAVLQVSSQREAREARATYSVGGDMRLLPDQAVGSTPSLMLRQQLAAVDGVRTTLPVSRSTTAVGESDVDVILADLADVDGTAMDVDAFEPAPPAGTVSMLADDRWASSGGVEIAPGTTQVDLHLDNTQVDVQGGQLLVADADGTVLNLRAERRSRSTLGLAWPEWADEPLRLVGLQLSVYAETCNVAVNPAARRVGERDLVVSAGLKSVTLDGAPTAASAMWSGSGTSFSITCAQSSSWSGYGLLAGAGGEPGGPYPAAVSANAASALDLSIGDDVELEVEGVDVTVRVADVVPLVPGVTDGRLAVLLDRSTLQRPLLLSGVDATPSEWWLDTDAGTDERAVAELGRDLTTRTDVLDQLANDPGSGGAGRAEALQWAAVGGTVVCLLLLSAAALLRRRHRAREAGVLRALGAGERTVVGVIGGEYVLTVGIGAVVGVVAGVVVTMLVLPAVTLGPGGALLVPPVTLTAPWLLVLLPTLLLVVLPLLLVLLMARTDARGAMVADLRTLEHG
ncbi:MAG: FtsX-like permease family protein [Propionibacteriales bacterium]|nr:FtsX-like permease family protein [Propionibacteriales bacterium]